MSNLSDKDIDRLSRDAAEFYEPDDSMLSWNKLEQQLIEHIPERPPDTHSFFRIRPLVWGPAVLLLAGITYYIIKNEAYSTHSTLKAQTENLASQPTDLAPVNGAGSVQDNTKAVNPREAEASSANASPSKTTSGNTHLPDASSGDVSAKTPAANASAENMNASNNSKRNNIPERTGGKISPLKVPVSKSIVGEPASANKGMGRHSKSLAVKTNSPGDSGGNGIVGKTPSSRLLKSSTTKNWKSNQQLSQSADEVALNNTSVSGNSQKNHAQFLASGVAKQNTAEQNDHKVQLPSLAISNVHPIVSGNDSSLNRFTAANTAQKPPLPKSLQINRSLTIGIVMGPDYTDVSGMSSDQLSNNIGISLGYHLTNRLSANTGFQYTAKYYWSSGKPFQPQNSTAITPYASFPHIESVNGSCYMYEIPLTLRYDILQLEKTRLFIGAGFSSYLVRKQDYTYFFHNAGRAYEWNNENNEHLNYWFAIGNFSAGIEQDFGKGFSFQVEPFVRTPFRGIGVGNIKMNSFGILFSIRYSPVLGRTRK